MRSFKAQLHPAPQYRRTTLPSAPLDVVTLWCGSNTLLDTTKTGTRAGTATFPPPPLFSAYSSTPHCSSNEPLYLIRRSQTN